MVFFEYEQRETFYHNGLQPLTKLMITGVLTLFCLTWMDLRLSVWVLLVSLALSIKAKVPRDWYKPAIFTMFVAIPMLVLTAPTLATKEFFKVYPPEWTQIEFLQITPPDFPVFGYTAFTSGTLLWMIARMVYIPILMFTWNAFVYSTSPNDMLQTFRTLKIPYFLVFTGMATYRFLPVMVRKTTTIINAQKLRGFVLESKNPLTVLKKYYPITYPMTNYLIDQVDEVAISTKSRGFGAGSATLTRDFSYSLIDKVFIVLSIVAILVAWYLLLFHNVGMM
jgi:energy-coupling factor transport system permease protein